MAEPVDRDALAALEEMTGGDRAFLVQLVAAYLDDAPAQLAAVRAAALSGDAAAAVRPAHTLKSSSATAGATPLTELARLLEAGAAWGAVDVGLLAEAEAEYGAVRRALADVRDR